MRKETFNNYYNKLLAYCSACNIKVYFDSLNGNEAEWSESERSIYIDSKKYAKHILIYNFLHEIGHFEVDNTADLKQKKSIAKSYVKYNHLLKLTFKDKENIINEEIRAWNSAIDVAKKLEIKLSKRFMNHFDYAIKNYKQILRNL